MSRADAAAIVAAVAAARDVANGLGVGADGGQLLHAGANVVARFASASSPSFVARVAHWTALVRPDPAAALASELRMASWLAARDVPVVLPSRVLPPGPHESPDGHVVTFWEDAGDTTPPVGMPPSASRPPGATRRDPPGDPVPDANAPDASDAARPGPHAAPGPAASGFGAALVALHRALADYPGELPDGPAAVVSDAAGAVRVAAAAGLLDAREARDVLAGASLAEALPAGGRPLHGDPHPRNVLTSAAGGLVWNDFEDAFRGPIEWDLGILARTAALDGAAARAAYEAARGTPADPGLVEACIRLRDWQALCWTLLSAAYRPERVATGRALLTRWLAS